MFLLVSSQKHPSATGDEDLKESSRPNSMTSNSSFHSTQDELDVYAGSCEDKEASSERRLDGEEEVRLLRQALESVQLKLLETRKENRSLQSQLRPQWDKDERARDKGREDELMESLAELQAKLTDTQERYHQTLEEVEELRAQLGAEDGRDVHAWARLQQEVVQLEDRLVQSASEKEEAAGRTRELEAALARAEEEQQQRLLEEEQKVAEIEELYKEAQEEIRILQVGAGTDAFWVI